MATPMLSAALIVKNEADNLPGCLASLTAFGPLLHEICVYDTGSSDDTVAIARSAGATVTEGYWDGDFSRARNEAIGMCSGRWVLIIDADERVQVGLAALRRRLRGASHLVDAFTISHRNQTDGRPVDMASIRILRRDRMRYIHQVHEIPERRDHRPAALVTIPIAELLMVHGGYVDPVRVADKLNRNLQIAISDVTRLDHDGQDADRLVKALVDRGRSYAALGQSDPAIADLERVRQQFPPSAYRAFGLERYVEELLTRKEWTQAAALLDELTAEGLSNTQLLKYHRARLAYGSGDPQTALDLVREVDVVTDAGHLTYPTTATIELRMLSAAQVGELEEALACCLQLIVHHGRVAGYGPLLIGLWGQRPAEALIMLLSDVHADSVGALVAELESAPAWGPQAAAALRAQFLAKSTPISV